MWQGSSYICIAHKKQLIYLCKHLYFIFLLILQNDKIDYVSILSCILTSSSEKYTGNKLTNSLAILLLNSQEEMSQKLCDD